MHRALDIRSAFSGLGARISQVRLAPQPSNEVALSLLSISFLFCVFGIVKIIRPKPSEDTTALDVPDKQLATKDLSKSRVESSAVPLSAVDTALASSPLSFLASLGAMIASPIVARPVPVPEPSSVLVDRTLDVVTKLEKSESPKQPYDAFLVLDVEATCQEGTDFSWPNEIIEWPVVLLRWSHKDTEGRAKELYVADEFRSFVKPTWRPELSAFCTTLTGITQAQVDRAPKFIKVLDSFREFLVRNGLIDAETGEKAQRYTWCTDGPFDIRDFVVKQCFISKIQMPNWLKGDVLDVRRAVTYYLAIQEGGGSKAPQAQPKKALPKPGQPAPKRRTLNIEQQLRALDLAEFIGRQHCGIDDTRNIARVVTELARRGIRLEPNTTIYPGRRWQWMGKPGQILEEYCFF